MQCALIWPDSHVCWEHRRAFELVKEVGTYLGKDLKQLILLGDFADFYFASGHGPKHPHLLNSTVKEVDAVNDHLDQFDKLWPSIKKTYIEGNHENRLSRFIQNVCPELFGYVDAKELFKINSRPGWNWCAYGPNQRSRVLNSKLWARHEPFGNSAKSTASRALCSVVYGHVHRIESAITVGIDGNPHIAFSVGWLGDKRARVFDYVKQVPQWNLGFALVYVDPKTGLFFPQTIQIIEHGNKVSCVVNGKRFTA